MVDAGRDGGAQQGDRAVRIPGRSPDTGTSQLHRPVPNPLNGDRRAGKGEPAAESLFAHDAVAPARFTHGWIPLPARNMPRGVGVGTGCTAEPSTITDPPGDNAGANCSASRFTTDD